MIEPIITTKLKTRTLKVEVGIDVEACKEFANRNIHIVTTDLYYDDFGFKIEVGEWGVYVALIHSRELTKPMEILNKNYSDKLMTEKVFYHQLEQRTFSKFVGAKGDYSCLEPENQLEKEIKFYGFTNVIRNQKWNIYLN